MSLLHSDVGHQDVIDSLAFSPDGQQILSGSRDGTAKLWDVQSGALLQTFYWGAEQVNAVAWSPDGETIAVAGSPPSIQLDESELVKKQAYFDHRDPAFHDSRSDFETLPTEEVHLYSAKTGALIRIFHGHGEGVAFAPNGQMLAMVSWERLSIIDLTSGHCVARYHGDHEAAFRNVFFSGNSRQVACVDGGGVLVFDAATASLCRFATDNSIFDDPEGLSDPVEPDPLATFIADFWLRALPGFRPSHSSDGGMEIQRISFSADGNLAAIHRSEGCFSRLFATAIGGITVLDLDSREVIRFFASPNRKWIRTTAFSPDSKLIAASGDHQTVVIWDIERGNEICRIGQPPPAMISVAFAPANTLVAAGTADGTLLLCDQETPRVIAVERVCESRIVHVEFTPDSKSLVVASITGQVRLLSLPGLNPICEFQSHLERFFRGAISEDGKRFVSVGCTDQTSYAQDQHHSAEITQWSLQDGQKLNSRTIDIDHRITSVCASNHGMLFAIASWKQLLLVDTSDGISIRTLLNRTKSGIARISFCADDKHLLLANEGYGMRIFDSKNADPLLTFVATQDGATSFAFSHDGSFLVRSTGYSPAVEWFELPTGILKKHILGHQAAVLAVALSPDDLTLVSGGADGTLKFWDVDTAKLRASIVISGNAADSGNRWQCLTE